MFRGWQNKRKTEGGLELAKKRGLYQLKHRNTAGWGLLEKGQERSLHPIGARKLYAIGAWKKPELNLHQTYD